MLNLSTCTEDDVIQAFQAGLRTFLRSIGGTFGSRRVTPRQEFKYPSDQEFAVLFPRDKGFSLHLFSVQFKKWDVSCWKLNPDQLQNLKSYSHIITYALPQPTYIDLGQALHYFHFVNPVVIPPKANSLSSTTNVLLAPLNVTDVAQSCMARIVQSIEFRLSLKNFIECWQNSIIAPKKPNPWKSVVLKSLRGLDTEIADELAKRLYPSHLTSECCNSWDKHLICSRNYSDSSEDVVQWIPRNSWGDFFSAVLLGSTSVEVPGSEEDPPSPGSPPGYPDFPGGFGLKLTCSGHWGARWAADQVLSHLRHWTRNDFFSQPAFLSYPAAVIAYESFSRSMMFLQIDGDLS